MYFVALKMLMGDKGKYIGILFGLTFTSLVMTQQPSIFVGIMTRTFGFVTDMAIADIWVMDSKVRFIDDIKPLQDTKLYQVRGVEGVEWAVPIYKGMIRTRLDDGNFQNCVVIGIDDASLIGGPPEMLAGQLVDLRGTDAVIVDIEGATDKLAKKGKKGEKIPLKIGDSIELNDKRAIVVGIGKTTRTFQSQPVIYTTYSRAMTYAPRERKMLSFVLVKARENVEPDELIQRIKQRTGLAAYTGEGFKWLTVDYYMKNTGIPINFGTAIALAFLVGIAIAGQTFYNFTLENLRQFGALKAMGATNGVLLRMILLQAFTAGMIGYGLGVGLAGYFGHVVRGSVLAFKMPWQLLALSGSAVVFICMFAACLSIIKVMRLEPAIVFKS